MLRIKRIKNSIKTYEPRIVEHNYCGHQLKVELRDALAEGWYDKDWDKLFEIDFLKEKGILKDGAKVFDLGAHQGIVAILLSKSCAPTGQVLAAEANSHNFNVASANCKLNNIENLNIIHAAVSDQEGKLNFSESLNGAVDDGQNEWGQVQVDCNSIDYLADNYFNPDIIYLDVEGYEFVALKGANKVLNNKTSWFIEVHGEETISRYGGTVAEVLDHFPEEKFELFMADDGKPFIPLDKSSQLIKERFFLIAISKA
jgi:FkbM family methyltransferase